MKNTNELRASAYHAELGQKLFAAFLAQQQGTSMNTALKKAEGPVSDTWLLVAEFALQAYNASVKEILTSPLADQIPNWRM